MNCISKEKKIISVLKGIAIVSVVYAHCNNLQNYDNLEKFINNISRSVGSVGVPIFFLISGYLYHRCGFFSFLKKKKWHIIAWCFTGTLVWGYEVVRKGFDYANLFRWLCGLGTYLWYMTTLFIFWIMFLYLPPKIIPVLMVVSILVSECIFDIELFPSLSCIFDYIVLKNFFRFLPFFILGYLFQTERKRIDKAYNIIQNKYLFEISMIFFLILLFIEISDNFPISYYSKLFILFEIVFVFLLLELIIKKIDRLIYLENVGENSFSIYLLHMPLAGAVANVCSRFRTTRLLVLLYPLIVIVVANAFCNLIRKKVPISWMRHLVGLR